MRLLIQILARNRLSPESPSSTASVACAIHSIAALRIGEGREEEAAAAARRAPHFTLLPTAMCYGQSFSTNQNQNRVLKNSAFCGRSSQGRLRVSYSCCIYI
jgi:hypothetical protein